MEHFVVPELVLFEFLDFLVVLSRLDLLELLLGADFANAVGNRPLLCVLARPFGKRGFKPGGRSTVQPAMSAGRGQQGMGAHICAPSLRISVANAPSSQALSP